MSSVEKNDGSSSVDSFTGNLSSGSKGKLPLPFPGAGAAAIFEHANGKFSEARMKKIMADQHLAELMLTDPVRAKRLLNNRQSAAKAQDLKALYRSELERKFQKMKMEASILSTQLTWLQTKSDELTAQNNELKFRVESVEKLGQLKDERAAREKNRAAAVTLNADVRRTKARLMEEVIKLQKLAVKKVKGLSPEEMALRSDLVAALPHRIQSIPDRGSGGAADQDGGWSGGNARPGIKFDSSAETFGEGYFQTSEESEQFRSEYEMRRIKQDEGLNIISEGLDTLKNLAEDMNEELDRQVPLMDEIDTKVDKANAELRKTNVRLKETVNQFRSTRNFTIDILICVILGITAYLYE